MKAEPKRRALGKGLSSLIPEAPAGDPLATARVDDVARTGEVLEVPIARIKPNPEQPRESFAETEIESLADSIRTSGLLQPLLVRPERDGSFTLIAGERRLRAVRRVGLTRVPVVTRALEDDRLLEYALVENLQRDDLRPIETAKAFRALIRRFGLTQSEVADRIGKPRSSVANFLRLLELPDAVQQMLESGSLTMGHGRALAALTDRGTQARLAQDAVRKGWSVRRIEEQVRRRLAASRAPDDERPGTRRDPNVVAAEQSLSQALAARVSIAQTRGGKGKIQIRFADDADLDRLYRQLLRPRAGEPSSPPRPS